MRNYGTRTTVPSSWKQIRGFYSETLMSNANFDGLLTSAARMFAERGYEGAGIRDIASTSGTPSTSIYYHFKSKQSLYQAALIQRYEETFDTVCQALNGKNSPGEKINLLVEILFDVFLEDKVLFTLVQRDMIDSTLSGARSALKGYHKKYMNLIDTLLTEKAGHPVDKGSAVTVASLIFGYCELMLITDSDSNMTSSQWLTTQKRYLCQQVQQLCTNLITPQAVA